MTKQNSTYDFNNFNQDTLTKPRDLAWSNWKKWETVGEKVQGFIRDAFYRKADGLFKEQRGITIEQVDGEMINVGIKTLPFVLNKTDDLRIGDPITIVFEKEEKSSTKGFNATKVFAFYGKNLPENASNKTVNELYLEDKAKGGTLDPSGAEDKVEDDEIDF